MSITKYYFTGATQAAQKTEMLTWLQANATDYFDSITEASDVITCSKNSSPILLLDFTGNAYTITMKLANGTTIQNYDTGRLWNYAVKCPGGIVFKTQGGTDSDAMYSILYITNSNTNGLIMAYTGYSNNYGHFYIGDIFSGSTWWDVYGGADQIYNSGYYINYWSVTAQMTSLTPIVTNVQTYAPNLYLPRFTEYPQREGILIVNNVEYYYTGYLAMK